MKIASARAAMLVGDQAGIQRLLRDKKMATDEFVELGKIDAEATALATERLSGVSSTIGSTFVSQQRFNIFINFDNTAEGLNASQALLSSLGHTAMTTRSAVMTPKASDRPPIELMPTAGGMALGLVGGIGVGMALEALIRGAANAMGHPQLGNLAIGLGLFGTAIGGAAGATGTLPKIKFPGIEMSFDDSTGNTTRKA